MLISIGLGVLAIAAGAPDAGAALIAGSQQFAMANFVQHTQAQESAADQAGLHFLEQSGQSGRGLITFFNTSSWRGAPRPG
jgi:predicted Zn-dependent protease